MSSHIFVDESKERDYLLVAAVILSGDLSDTVQDSAKPGSPTVRMAARAHFLKLSATGTPECRRIRPMLSRANGRRARSLSPLTTVPVFPTPFIPQSSFELKVLRDESKDVQVL